LNPFRKAWLFVKVKQAFVEGNVKAFQAVLEWLVKLKVLQGHRRQIGIGAVLASGALTALTSAGVIAAFPVLATAAPVLATVGTYIALVGAAYKDDPK